ncbi:MAG: FYDLN acid domain-containing protein [Proteobacteria bacterium]|nr:FYDLN acid domain-containing protein [Pseudomonadota bacterium]
MATAKKSSAKRGGSKKSASVAKKPAPSKKPVATKKAAPAKPVSTPRAFLKAVAKAVTKAAKPLPPPTKPAIKEKVTPAPPPARPIVTKSAKPRSKKPARAIVVKAGTAAATKLGTKWTCFRCAAKFYDLNKPLPLCPRCSADQRERPKVAPTPPAPAPRKQPRPMAPLLEDEDDGTVRYEEDIDLGVRTETDEPDEELFPPGEFEEDEPFSGPEEE